MYNFEELKKLDEKQKLAVHCLWQGQAWKKTKRYWKSGTRPKNIFGLWKTKSYWDWKKELKICAWQNQFNNKAG